MKEFVHCAKCHLVLLESQATKITATIAPRVVIYYHPECYDPWAEPAADEPLVWVASEHDERRTVSSTGGEKGVKPARFDLIPVGPLTTVAKLYGKGAEKYDDHNWARGYEWSKSYAALMRHVTQFWGGEDIDTDTGLPHMASVVFHALALIEFMEEHRSFDDRPIAKGQRSTVV